MRVTDRYQSIIQPAAKSIAGQKARSSNEAAKTSAVQTPATKELVEVSARAKALAANNARVEELKEAVEKGTYKFDPAAIAAKLVGSDE